MVFIHHSIDDCEQKSKEAWLFAKIMIFFLFAKSC